MPEKPEVITVARKLESKILNRKITNVEVLHRNMIEGIEVEKFVNNIKGQTINSITTRGKWIMIELDKDYLFVHLRMTGKFFYRQKGDEINKHEHVILTLDNEEELRFHDTRKFGKMRLVPKEKANLMKPLSELGLEPWDEKLTTNYLKDKFLKKTLPIKTVLLDQTIITGIGNIYADEILFESHLNPLKRSKDLNTKELDSIIKNTVKVLDKAIEQGGTTIRDYTSEEGVTGLFQNYLNVHTKENEPCPICKNKIEKIVVNGRSTYYCKKCQK